MAKYTQLRDANMNTGYTGGWCLKFTQDAFNTDHPYPTAIASWNANYSNGNHPNELPPAGVTVPVYFTLGSEPAGHVAIKLDDGWVASSTQGGYHPKPFLHKNLADLIAVYGRYNGGCNYLGWSEYMGSVRVVKPSQVNANDNQIRQAYLDILERPADDGAIVHYRAYTNEFMRNDLMASRERQVMLANKQAQAEAQAAAEALAEMLAQAQAQAIAEAQALAEQKAKEDAEKAAQAIIDQEARDKAIADQKAKDDAVVPVPPVASENNLIAIIIRIIKRIIESLRG